MPRTASAKSQAQQLPEHLASARTIRDRLVASGFVVDAVGPEQDRLGLSLRDGSQPESPAELVSLVRVSLTPEEFELFRAERERVVELMAWERRQPGKR